VKETFELAFLVSEASDGKNLRVEKTAEMHRGARGVSRLLVSRKARISFGLTTIWRFHQKTTEIPLFRQLPILPLRSL
jgi:hypothetical protein